jgi:5'-3' exonuclease
MYKAHRVAPDGGEQIPSGLVPQVPLIEQVIDAIGLARVGVAGYEADDVIGTLATQPDRPVDIVSGDRDLFQLVDDSVPVRVLYTARGMANIVVVDEAEVTRRYNIPGRAYADYALLRGDPSDGLPGVSGIGEKTAATLITRYGGLEEILAAANRRELAGPVASKLAAAHDYVSSASVVVCVAKDVPLPTFDPTLPSVPKDPDLLEELRERWALSGPVERLRAALAIGAD